MTPRVLLSLGLLIPWLCAAPAWSASIEGKVVHSDPGRSVAGVTVKLFAADEDGGSQTSETQTSDDGEFSFDGLAPELPYGVYVEYQDVTFPAEFVEFDPPTSDASAQVRLEIQDPTENTSGLQIFQARTLVGKGEAGAYQVRQIFYMTNSSDSAIYARDPDASLFDIGLLPRHEGIEAIQMTSNQVSPAKIELQGDRARYRGPVFPGIQTLDLAYEVDAGGPDLETELEFHTQVADFVLMVPDRRQAVSAEGLYPSVSRGERAQEPRGFQYFRGFDITPGTRVDLRIEEIPEPGDSVLAAAFGVALLLFGMCVYVGLPIASDLRGSAPPPPPDEPISASDALVASLRDLEHDFEMGKISEADRDQLRQELHREAVLELARQREAKAKQEPPAIALGSDAAPASFCRSCGGATGRDDRFCRSCGTQL